MSDCYLTHQLLKKKNQNDFPNCKFQTLCFSFTELDNKDCPNDSGNIVKKGWQWGGYGAGILSPVPAPLSLPHPSSSPRSVLGGTFFSPNPPHRVPTPPQYEFSYIYFFCFSFWLNYIKKKKIISMTTIDLLANKFSTNLFIRINLHEATIYA